MDKKVWLVTRSRHTTDNDSFVVLGIFEDEGDAIQRVNEAFLDDLDNFEEFYEVEYINADNHNNGYAELHYGDSDYDDIIIRITSFELNKPAMDAIE